ncbi:MAG: hypothetical protein CFH06_01673 [Alphaproteobacteria bacterium MarineAlpha3_Bin5]|nr:MAG: hypothetical protein CFH06_01673 [Alphaproteobacteria bacterium MarineAlpha3_Bin5]
MPNLTILYWRDIPSQVIVKTGRKAAKLQLSNRFQEAIDSAAMKSKAHENDSYLSEWRRSQPISVQEPIEEEVHKATKNLEREYDEPRLALLVSNGGYDKNL